MAETNKGSLLIVTITGPSFHQHKTRNSPCEKISQTFPIPTFIIYFFNCCEQIPKKRTHKERIYFSLQNKATMQGAGEGMIGGT